LLLALVDNPRAADVLRGCAVDVETMRADVSQIVRDSTPVAPGMRVAASQAGHPFRCIVEAR